MKIKLFRVMLSITTLFIGVTPELIAYALYSWVDPVSSIAKVLTLWCGGSTAISFSLIMAVAAIITLNEIWSGSFDQFVGD